ncbi:formate/nitrite transporter family protein [Demequina sp. SYSU T00039]|uniref:Formate/nitrite transporter family protein n=1 Tax=Demequina lignilytica TaxID=3051663 RepID=A0AAW7M9X3_9MICO|nr:MULTISPECIES: formate/nitrite transporter family protein [unclassified Demequina]MDN4478896.1 formate/nitrite transporter family protein [Demequina sp. SYSU T00039-1]MDN4488771.1 formate/nitrite transporter family protein [Demequina sp. SYSU T00039]MDN4491845.1 formate/nitrite transporter family protein [Demequina sp. SYSU T00068]
MLTLPDTVDVHARAAAAKVTLARTPLRLLVSAMLAGMWIGVGDTLMWAAAGPFAVAGDPAAKLVAGAVFAAALTIVVFAGSELATSAMMILPIGALRGTITWWQGARVLLAIVFSNMVGAFALAWVLLQTGVLAHGPAGEFFATYLEGKIDHTPSELFWRGVMCNVLVCVAIWAAARLTNEVAKAVIIFWAVLAFIAAGFEHVVANMTTFALGLLGGAVDVTWLDFGTNMVFVGLGNLVGGGLVIGVAYAFVAGKARREDSLEASYIAPARGESTDETDALSKG